MLQHQYIIIKKNINYIFFLREESMNKIKDQISMYMHKNMLYKITPQKKNSYYIL
jgi:hypothetical protein